jgi:CRP-like cAMP-binding protein/lysophospholipase L1-like esterase
MSTPTTSASVVSDFVAAITAGLAADRVAHEWVELVRGLTEIRDVEPDEVLVRHHAVAEHLYFLVEGEVSYEHLVSGRPRERVSHDAHRWLPIGWSSVHLRRYRVTAVAATHGRVLCLPLTAWDELAARAPRLWAMLAEFTFRTAARMLWEARGTQPATSAPGASPASRLPLAVSPEPAAVQDMYQRSACFSALPTACRDWLSDHSTLYRAGEGVRILAEGAASEGLSLLTSGRAAMRFRVAAQDDGHGERIAVRHAVRSGTLLCWSAATETLPTPYDVEAVQDSTLAFVPREALAGLLEQHPAWLGAIFEQQLWQLRGYLLSTRTHYGHGSDDGGIGALRDIIEDSKPVLPVNSRLYGIPHLLENKLTRGDGFRRLYETHFEGDAAERSLASLALDLLRDLERGHRFFTGLQATYDAVVRDEERDAHDLRRIASRYFRDALTHVPYVIKGLEHLPDDGNCILIYNHMAYADDSVLPNGFLFNPDSHFVSSVLMEPKYGDGLRVARTNATTEFWRADYYDRLGHIGVVTPESGWRDETLEEKARRKQRFLASCEDALARGRPLAIAPEGTITEAESTTEQSPAPMKAGAFVMSARFASRPSIVPVALANFDRPAHRTVFSCVIKPPFTMEERSVDVDDRDSMQAFLVAYRGEFRDHVEEAIALAHHIQTPEAELDGLVTNLGRVDAVNEEFEHDVRTLEHRASTPAEGVRGTVFYGSSTFRMWDDLADQVGVPDVVNLGFGGSTFEACRHYFERLVVPYAPTRLVIYCGDNDLARGATAADVTAEFTAFDEMVTAHLPRTACWFVSIKPSPGRRQALGTVRRANAQIADRIERLAHWEYVDWHRYMVDERGMPNPHLFTADAVHVNEAGYGVLAALLRRVLG